MPTSLEEEELEGTGTAVAEEEGREEPTSLEEEELEGTGTPVRLGGGGKDAIQRKPVPQHHAGLSLRRESPHLSRNTDGWGRKRKRVAAQRWAVILYMWSGPDDAGSADVPLDPGPGYH